MTPDEAQDFVARISFGYPLKAWGACIFTSQVFGGPGGALQAIGFNFRLERTPHRDTGAPTAIDIRGVVSCVDLANMSQAVVFEYIRRTFFDLVRHEVEESLLLDGTRHTDPHALDRG